MRDQRLRSSRRRHNRSRGFLKKNLSALREVDPSLAESISKAGRPGDWEALTGRSGQPTLRVTTPAGRKLFLHSQYDPEEEARRVLSRYDLKGVFTFVVLGFGLGYHVEELLREERDLLAIVIEKDARVLKEAFEKRDFTQLICDGKLVILLDPTKAELMRRLNGYTVRLFAHVKEGDATKGATLIRHPASAQLHPEFYRGQMRSVLDFFEHGGTSLRTAMILPIDTKYNLLMNLPWYVYQPGIGVLKGCFKGYPAVVVTAGPSLAKNIDQLRDVSRRAVIIAVGTIYKTLLSHGVVPHFVTTLDWHRISGRYLEGVGDYSGSILVAEPKGSHEAVESFRGRKLFAGNDFLDFCVEGLGMKWETIKGGATVAHLAFYLADYMGASPIMLVGQDLSYPHHVTHIPGSAIHRGWYPEQNRFNTMEMMEWQEIARVRLPRGKAEKIGENLYMMDGQRVEPLLRKVKDVFGNEIYTDAQMYSYLLQFERDFELASAEVIDATEGGVRKKGTRAMKLSEAAEEYCGKEIPEELLKLEVSDFLARAPGKEMLRKELERHADEVEETMGLYEEALELLGEIKRRFEDRYAVKNMMPRVVELRERINARKRLGEQMSEISQKAEFRKARYDLEIAGKGLEGVDKQKMQLERDMDYMSELRTGGRLLLDMLKAAMRRVDEFDMDEARRLWGVGEGAG